LLRALAEVSATKRGYALTPIRAREVVVLALPVEDPHAPVLALLSDGEAWSSSALALALGPASAARSGLSKRSRQSTRCSRSGAGGLDVGSPRRCRDSRQLCYSPAPWRLA